MSLYLYVPFLIPTILDPLPAIVPGGSWNAHKKTKAEIQDLLAKQALRDKHEASRSAPTGELDTLFDKTTRPSKDKKVFINLSNKVFINLSNKISSTILLSCTEQRKKFLIL